MPAADCSASKQARKTLTGTPMLTEPRTDLPSLGEKIAVLHGSGAFYVGPMDVVEVDPPRQLVTLWPNYWPTKHYIVFRPHREEEHPLKWNRVDALSDAEREGLKSEDPDLSVGVDVEIHAREPEVFTSRSITGRNDESESGSIPDPNDR